MYYHQFLVSRELGGAGLIALHLSKWLIQCGARTRIWLPGPGPAARAAEEQGLVWRRYGFKTMTKSAVPHTVACIQLALKLMASRGLVHVYTPTVYRLIRPALRLTDLRTAVHVQLEPTREEVCWAFQDPPHLVIPCAKYFTGLIREMLGERGRRLRIVAVPNAVDTELFFPGDRVEAKQRVRAQVNIPLVLMLANLAPHKGQETAIRAVAELRARGTVVECWLAGIERDGSQEYRQHLLTLARECGVADRIRFLGFRNDSADLLRAADIFVLPSTWEGLPISILEAQACKVPVLAAPTAGVPEVVQDGITGFLIPAKEAIVYAQRIQSLLSNPNLSHRITQQAYESVLREYNWPTYCERIWGLYQELLAPESLGGPRRRSVNLLLQRLLPNPWADLRTGTREGGSE